MEVPEHFGLVVPKVLPERVTFYPAFKRKISNVIFE
jgi:hypothetical protein